MIYTKVAETLNRLIKHEPNPKETIEVLADD